MQTPRDPPTPEGDEKKPPTTEMDAGSYCYYHTGGPPQSQRAALILGEIYNHVYVKSLDSNGHVVWK